MLWISTVRPPNHHQVLVQVSIKPLLTMSTMKLRTFKLIAVASFLTGVISSRAPDPAPAPAPQALSSVASAFSSVTGAVASALPSEPL